MDNINYYEKLKADYPTFNSTLRLDERQQKSLDSLLGYTEGALSSFRSKVQEADSKYADFNEKAKREKRAEVLREAKTKSKGSIEAAFQQIENRVASAKSALYAATHQGKPQDSTEALLRFLQQKEIRDGLETMPVANRVEALHNACQDGHGVVLWAIEGQPIISELVPADVMDRATGTLAGEMAPQQAALVELAEQDLEGALAVKNLAEVEIRRIEV